MILFIRFFLQSFADIFLILLSFHVSQAQQQYTVYIDTFNNGAVFFLLFSWVRGAERKKDK